MNKKNKNLLFPKHIIVMVTVGIILMGCVFALFSYNNTENAKNVTAETIEYIKNQCIRYDEITSSDLTKSLFRIIDKTKEISRDMLIFNDSSDNIMKSFIGDHKLTGVMLLDEKGELENELYSDDTGYDVWKSFIHQDNVLSVAYEPIKIYADRIHSSPSGATSDNDYYYDFAAVARTDKKGIVFAYLRQTKSVIDNGQPTLDLLLSGFKLAMNGSIIITDKSNVIATNNEKYTGKAVVDCKILESYASSGDKANGLLRIVDDDGSYYGGMDKCRNYYIYVCYPAGNVYIGRWAATSLATTIYIIICFVAILFYRSIQVKHIRETRIAEEKYNAKLLQSADEARRANMAKSDFLRRMSHDIRTPINGIRGMIEIADKNDDDPEKRKECRRKMWVASGYLLELVNDILDMNKLESGEIVLEYEPFDIYDIFDDIFTLNEQNAYKHNISLTFEKCENIHNRLIGSPLHVKRVLMNIISNAVKYGREGGYVKVSCKELSVTEDGKTAMLSIKCEDNGKGIGEDFRKVMYEPFRQENESARTSYQGTGLGLPIAKRLTEKMGGTIECESTKNVGTDFTIVLPLDIDMTRQSKSKSEVVVEDRSLAGVNILLAEDNELNMEITEFMLKSEGATVIKAWNGAEAVEIFKSSELYSIDVILMDIMMPVVDGLEASETIRHLYRADAISVPIIALTANAFTDDKIKTQTAGMNEHLAKPVESKKLKDAVFSYIGRKNLTMRECYDLLGEDYDSVLQRLECEEENVEPAIREFLFDKHFAEFSDAMKEHSVEKAFRAAHTMKGIAANLGFEKFRSVFSEITEYLRKGDYDSAQKLLVTVGKEYIRIIRALKRCK